MKKFLTLIAIVSMLVTTDSNCGLSGTVGYDIVTEEPGLFEIPNLVIQNTSKKDIKLVNPTNEKSITLPAGSKTKQAFRSSNTIQCFSTDEPGSSISCKANKIVLLEDCQDGGDKPCVLDGALYLD